MRFPLIPITLFFSAGIILERFLPLPWLFILLPAIISLITAIIFFRYERLCTYLILLSIFLLGAFSLKLHTRTLPASHIEKVSLDIPSLITLKGQIHSFPVFKAYQNSSDTNPSGSMSFDLELKEIHTLTLNQTSAGIIKVRVQGVKKNDLKYGDHIITRGLLQHPYESENFGVFNYRQWLADRGIYYTLHSQHDQLTLLDKNSGNKINHMAWKLRERVMNTLSLGLENSPEHQALLGGMLLGYREELPDQINYDFAQTGTFHILAVSGQNLSMIALIFVLLFRSLRIPKPLTGIIIIPILLIYCASVGWQPGCLRAFWMATAVIGSWIIIRPLCLWSSLCFAALITLLFMPQQLFDAGFQLSFAVVIALIYLTPRIYNLIKNIFSPDPFLIPELIPKWRKLVIPPYQKMAMLTAASLAAWLGSLPLILIYFQIFAPVTVLANIFVAPLATLILSMGLVSFLSSFISPWLSILYNHANSLFVSILISGIHLFAQIPLGSFNVSPAHFTSNKDSTKIHLLSDPGFTPLLIESPSGNLLLNPGNENTSRFLCLPYLKYHGITKLNLITQTNRRKSHPEGKLYLEDHLTVNNEIMPESIDIIYPQNYTELKDLNNGVILCLSLTQKKVFIIKDVSQHTLKKIDPEITDLLQNQIIIIQNSTMDFIHPDKHYHQVFFLMKENRRNVVESNDLEALLINTQYPPVNLKETGGVIIEIGESQTRWKTWK